MMKRWLICVGTVIGVFVTWISFQWISFQERQTLNLKRTIVAKVPTKFDPITALLPTDLNGDGKAELLVLSGYNPPTLILHPFERPKILRLPPPIGDLSGLTPALRMKHYPTFQLTWLWLERTKFAREPFPPQICGTFKGAKAIDADGDGDTDDLLVVMRDGGQLKRWQFTLSKNGYWQLKGALPNIIFVGHSLLDRHLLISDLDNDGKTELVKAWGTINRWNLEVWSYEPRKRQWKCVVTSPTFSVAPLHQLSGIDTLWAHDIDNDGRKEIVGIWWFAVDPSSKYYLAKIFSFKWQGKRLTMHRLRQRVKEPAFDIRTIFLCNPIFEHDEVRYFLLPKMVGFRFPFPQLISLSPPRFKWWVDFGRMRTEIWLLPKGKDAFEPSKWQKIAELPGEPLAVGDWDKDGKIEMFLRSGVLIGTEFPRAVIARLQGEKVQWAEWHLGCMRSPTCVLPLVEGNKFALFVGWNDGTIERVQLQRVGDF